MPKCNHAPPPDDLLLTKDLVDQNVKSEKSGEKKVKIPSETFTLAALIEELNSSNVASLSSVGTAVVAKGKTQKQQLQTASKFAKRLAPVLAAGGVVGAIAMGPAAGVLAGLNMLVASVGAETVMAGIGLTASAAAAATVTHQTHVLGATLQYFPSLASTPEAVNSCTLAVERIVYDDIYAMVFSEFQRAFRDADTVFADNLAGIRQKQKYHSSALLLHPHQQQSISDNKQRHPVLAEELQIAETKLVAMKQETCSPLLKLALLCDAFRSVCCFAERLHQSVSNADMLIPILCALLVECPRVCSSGTDFVAEIAFISFFTNGGGKGVEGYVLTTFQAAIQVIVAVDLPTGHAKELELFIDDDDVGSEAADDEEDDDEFFDAVSTTTT
ncbi:hypothetical protein BBJ29_003799 [Phytophthora kernoviae]|uniref:VPS9 domain-containing protein n=1 Tax=Phytophthora kernoviae TaxID=325452 RepID=A0A3F2RHS4_9STRA|nr:hypothetical protein BBP00_00008120 [Phytophthora kernoviae]RLN66871.1 hypothetical protein BBJ29_003799 [Phytophthora kernoviae]